MTHELITTTTELITPEKAALYLQRSTVNRKLRWDVVMRLVRIIKRGEWVVTPDGVSFDTNDRLLNSHHRLNAVIEAGVAVYMRVTRGLDPNSWTGIDICTPRTLTDVTGLDRKEVDVAQFIIQLCGGRHGSQGEVRVIAEPLHPIQEKLREAYSGWKRRLTAPVRAGFVLAGYTELRPIKEVQLLYRAFGMADFSAMPTSMQSLYRQLMEDDRARLVANHRRADFARTLVALNPKKADKSRIIAANPEKYSTMVKELFLPILQASDESTKAHTTEVVYNRDNDEAPFAAGLPE